MCREISSIWCLSLLLAVLGAAVAGNAMAQSEETPAIVPDVLDQAASILRDNLAIMQIGVALAGERIVSVGERGVVLISDDQGKSWRQARSVPVSVTLTDVAFSTDTNGWASGHSGVLLKTTDAGENWQLVYTGMDVAELVLKTARERVTQGIDGADREVRGAELLVEDGPDKPLLSIYFDNSDHGWVLGAYGIALETRDGGNSWSSVGHLIPNDFGAHLYGMTRSGRYLLIAGEQGAAFVSSDDGATFHSLDAPYPGTFFGVAASTDGAAVFYGLRGNVWKADVIAETVMTEEEAEPGEGGPISNNLYAEWVQLDNGPAISVTAAATYPNGSVLLADEGGRFTLDGPGGEGATMLLEASAGSAVNDIVLIGGNTVVLAGPRGVQQIELNTDGRGNK